MLTGINQKSKVDKECLKLVSDLKMDYKRNDTAIDHYIEMRQKPYVSTTREITTTTTTRETVSMMVMSTTT